jgi:tRNA modification GTPase
MFNETIVAVATPPGRGGVGIIRLSGSLSLEIAQKLSQKTHFPPRQAVYSALYDNQKEMLDDGIILYFKSPNSFTGEDVIELQCHGSPVVLDSLIMQCILLGARMAKPGEFSERAFLNDKMDLTQAEAVADLINASSETAARMAVKSLQGEFSNKINQLNEKIIHLRLYIEATIDFSDEEIDFIAEGKVALLLDELLENLQLIRQQATQGALLREGLSVVIAGPPNAGKSTLINQLAKRDVAIVTDVPGTTRDVMREQILLDDLPIHIIDTAGLRESEDIVEKEGIRRAFDEIKRAECPILNKVKRS